MSFIIILAGLLVVLIGFLFYKKHKDLKRVCTTQTTGKVIDIRREKKVNPNNSEQFYVVEDKAVGRFGIYFMIFGAAILIIGIVTIFVPISSV